MCVAADWRRLKNSLPGPIWTPCASPVTCTPSEVPPEKRLLEITTPLGPGECTPEVVTVIRPSPHDEHGSMLSKVPWSTRMFALAMVETICSVAVKVLLAIVTSGCPAGCRPGWSGR